MAKAPAINRGREGAKAHSGTTAVASASATIITRRRP